MLWRNLCKTIFSLHVMGMEQNKILDQCQCHSQFKSANEKPRKIEHRSSLMETEVPKNLIDLYVFFYH